MFNGNYLYYIIHAFFILNNKYNSNFLKVYFDKHPRHKIEPSGEESGCSEQESLLQRAPDRRTRKQTFSLLLLVAANLIYLFGTVGVGSIFTLFIMNAPFCFDSIQISNFSVFATVLSLFVSLLISKFIRVNDVIICILSTLSYFVSIFFFILAQDATFIYLGSAISSPAGLEYGYVRSIVSKSVAKEEIADALSLILIVDTIGGVVASMVFQILYASIVSNGITTLFSFANGFVLIATICHV